MSSAIIDVYKCVTVWLSQTVALHSIQYQVGQIQLHMAGETNINNKNQHKSDGAQTMSENKSSENQ